MEVPTSLFDRFFSQPRPAWFKLIVSVLLLSLPFAAAYLDGTLNELIRRGNWRVLLLAPSLTIYIWYISPVMVRVGNDVVRSIRPLILLDDESFDEIVDESSRINPKHEWLAFGIGAILGIVSSMATGFEQNDFWLKYYWILSTGFMYGLLAWTIFVSIAGTRLNVVLYKQPIKFDILDPSPFETIGRQSLILALVFIGGITLSLVCTFQLESITAVEFWVIYFIMVLVTVVIFFFSMRSTHQLLTTEKKHQLEPVRRHLNSAYRELVQRLEQKQDVENLVAELNALNIYEQRLQAARTWPYNTTMLRTLFFSVLIPLVTVLGRLLIEVIFP